MRFEDLLNKYRTFPVLDIKSVSLVFNVPVKNLSVQFSRWVRSNKLIKLRQGLYLFSKKYRQTTVDNHYLSSVILQPSYISMEKALEYYGLIPENIFAYTALTTKRANTFSGAEGTYSYRHIQSKLFREYKTITEHGLSYYIATPEKALLDYIYVNRFVVTKAFIEGLRLQNLDELKLDDLKRTASFFNNKNIDKAVALIACLKDEEVKIL